VRRTIFFLLFVAFVGFAVPAHAAVITFESAGLIAGDGPDPYFGFGDELKGTIVDNQFASLGVLFSHDALGTDYISDDSFQGPMAPWQTTGNYLVVSTLPLSYPPRPTTLQASFIDPTTGLAAIASDVSVVVSDWNAAPDPRVIVNAFDLSGNVIETQILHNSWSTLSFTSSNIARLDFVDNGGDGHIIDNLSYSVHSVPEPGTLGLLSLGIMTVVARRRRRA